MTGARSTGDKFSVQPARLRVGCAGWSIPAIIAAEFPDNGSHLARYSQRLPAVEINSSFYRPHRHSTYVRWAESVPSDFRFSVKMPRLITHELRLLDVVTALAEFFGQIAGLQDKLGCVLVQLPPSLRFDEVIATDFLRVLRELTDIAIVIEPRHASWFSNQVNFLLHSHRVGRVAADPPPVQGATTPAGWQGSIYFRLHGSPRMYYSSYSSEYIGELAMRIEAAAVGARDCWCIFDNTAAGAAWRNALQLQFQHAR